MLYVKLVARAGTQQVPHDVGWLWDALITLGAVVCFSDCSCNVLGVPKGQGPGQFTAFSQDPRQGP